MNRNYRTSTVAAEWASSRETDMDIVNETERFVVVPRGNGHYAVQDKLNGRYVRYGYNNPPLYARSKRSITEWDNYYSARVFCQKLAERN